MALQKTDMASGRTVLVAMRGGTEKRVEGPPSCLGWVLEGQKMRYVWEMGQPRGCAEAVLG